MDSFEEAIRDHLRLRGDNALSEEQLGDLFGRAPPASQASTRPRPRNEKPGAPRLDGRLQAKALPEPRERPKAVGRVIGYWARTSPRTIDAVRPMLPRLGLGLTVLAAAGVLVPAAVAAVRPDRIADGVRVGGVPVGGLSARSAHRVLEQRFAAANREPLILRSGRRRWRLMPSASLVSADVSAAVRTALARSRGDAFLKRFLNAVARSRPKVELPAPVSFSDAAVDRLVERISRAVERKPRDATVRPIGRRLDQVPDRPGLAVDRPALERLVGSRLASAAGPRGLSVPTRLVRARVTAAELPSRYRRYVVIRRSRFRLEYFHNLRRVRSYPIAIGMQGLETPAGLYHVQGKQVNPSWQVPNSQWAGSQAGQLVPPGPRNPIKARWLGFNGSAGIHGTTELGSLGQAASHGCVRMSIPDVKDLYRRVRLDTPVRID